MRATVSAVAIAGLLAVAALPVRAELGPCKRDAQELPLCGSGKGAARVVRNTMSPDKKFALAWRHPDKGPADVTEDDTDLELLLIRLADGVVLAKGDTDYFRNPGVTANRREEFAIWSPDSRMVIRQLDPRYGTEFFTLYRIGADGALAGDVDLIKIITPAVLARLKKIGRDPKDYTLLINNNASTLGNDGMLRFEVIMFVIKKEPEVDYKVEMKVTPGKAPLRARIVSIRQTRRE
jgi:hypothetical protein